MTASHTLEDFWASIEKTDGCWLWKGTRNNMGYGWFHYQGKSFLAHRYSFELAFGKIPHGLLVLHHCDHPLCVNPEHLFLGTQADNMHDMISKGRANLARGPEILQGEHNATAKLTNEKVLQIRELRRSGLTLRELSKRFGVCVSEISQICLRQVWQHLP